MADAANIREYVLGNSFREQERLKLQARILGGWTREYLLAAGLQPGMRVLDVGTGMGDVALLASAIVGPSGAVVGIDRDPSVLQRASARFAELAPLAPYRFLEADAAQFVTDEVFDAVVGRYVLLYQRDPAASLRHFCSLTRPGGILCFHEISLGSPVRSYPAQNLFSEMVALIGEVFRRMNVDPDLGLKLASVFAEAGLPRPAMKADVPLGGEAGSYTYGWAAETVRSLLPRIEQLGLAKVEDLEIETLAQRMEEQAVACHGEILGPLQFGAWLRLP